MNEHIGPFIERARNGAIRFEYGSGIIEYHPEGGKPTSFDEEHLCQRILESYTELVPDWFYVTYIVHQASAAAGGEHPRSLMDSIEANGGLDVPLKP